MLAHMHPSRWRFAHGSRLVDGTAPPAQYPRPGPSPPGAQSPFARNGRYPVRPDVRHHVGRHCPSFIAHTGSCVRPSPSHRFRYTLIRRVFAGCCQSVAGKWPFPALSPQSLCGCSDPYHAAPLRCACSFLPEGHRHHPRDDGIGTPNNHRNATSTVENPSRPQSFRYVRAPTLARPPDSTHRWSVATRRPGRLRHAMNRRLPSLSRGIATCLNRAIGTAGLSPAGLWPCRPLPIRIAFLPELSFQDKGKNTYLFEGSPASEETDGSLHGRGSERRTTPIGLGVSLFEAIVLSRVRGR
jgi:hypothetical protein